MRTYRLRNKQSGEYRWVEDCFTPVFDNSGQVLGTFSRPGRMAGELKWVHNLAIDSKGNLYTAEVGTGRRAQKFSRQP